MYFSFTIPLKKNFYTFYQNLEFLRIMLIWPFMQINHFCTFNENLEVFYWHILVYKMSFAY